MTKKIVKLATLVVLATATLAVASGSAAAHGGPGRGPAKVGTTKLVNTAATQLGVTSTALKAAIVKSANGQVDAAVADGACDYLMFGTVFPSAGKPQGHRVAGVDALREACRRSPIPVIAIGGIDRSRLGEIAQSGAAGFAAVAMFM